MASRDDNSGSGRHSQQEDNPFIAFRRYADEQMANLLQSFIGLPSAFTTQAATARWRPYDDEARRRKLDAWASQNEEDTTTWQREARRREVSDAEEAAARYTTPSEIYSRHPTDCTDNNDELAVCPYRPVDRQLRDETSFDTPTSALAWPISYMLFSPYSPYRLERKEPFCDYGSRWRDAFEDLLFFEGMDAESQEDSPAVKRPDLMQFLNGISPLCSHHFVKELCHESPDCFQENLGTRQPENDFEKGEMTELDFYEQLLQRQKSEREQSRTWVDDTVKESRRSVHADGRKAQDTAARSETGNKLGIVSTLTTTERVALPDGTVHTKLVLKKRFADGREESSETVHTSQGGLQNQHEQSSFDTTANLVDAAKPQKFDQTEKTQKKGWFWS